MSHCSFCLGPKICQELSCLYVVTSSILTEKEEAASGHLGLELMRLVQHQHSVDSLGTWTLAVGVHFL